MVWAAGVKVADFMKDIGGLETNRINQLVVHDTLVTTRDPAIFAIGDCAECTQPGAGHGCRRAGCTRRSHRWQIWRERGAAPGWRETTSGWYGLFPRRP